MNADKILELLFYTLPALITGAVAYHFFLNFVKNEESRRKFIIARENQKTALPLRLQAYERMTLYMERIEPAKLLTRITPLSDDKTDYANYVVAQIEQEYEHNLTQQIYMSDDCWTIITTAKNATIQMLRKAGLNNEISNADSLRQTIINDLFDKPSPGSAALAYIRNEVKEYI